MTKAKETRKAAKIEAKKTDPKKELKKAPAKVAEPQKEKEPKLTKKAIIMQVLEQGGGTITEMATLCTKAGLGDQDRNEKTCKLWMSKLGVPVKRDDKGFYSKA